MIKADLFLRLVKASERNLPLGARGFISRLRNGIIKIRFQTAPREIGRGLHFRYDIHDAFSRPAARSKRSTAETIVTGGYINVN